MDYRGFKGLQRITRAYKGLLGITRDYKGLLGSRRNIGVYKMIARVHNGLQGITRVYKGLQWVAMVWFSGGYKSIQWLTRDYNGNMGIQGFTMDCKSNTRVNKG